MGKRNYGFFIKYWIFCIAVIIVCINIFCRVKDAIASSDYEKSEGTVASVRTGTATFKEGGYRGHSYTYRNGDVHYATIEYKTADGAYQHFQIQFGYSPSVEEFSNRYFQVGDPVTVMYKKDGLYYKTYLAEKDWITGAWLDAGKHYNTPLIIAMALMAAGIAYLYWIGVLTPHFKNSRIVVPIVMLVSGVLLTVFSIKTITEGGELADEAFAANIIGCVITLISFIFVVSIPGKLRKKKEPEPMKPEE